MLFNKETKKEITSIFVLACNLLIIHLLTPNSNNLENLAIAPMLAVGLGSAALQTGMGIWQAKKANKQKVDTSARDKALAQQEENQKQLISRAKNRAAIGTGVPGQSQIEGKLEASTAKGVTDFKEMGSQASFQDYLNKSVQREQDALMNLGVKGAEMQRDAERDVDSAIAGLQGIYQQKAQIGSEEANQQRADIAQAKQTASSNITGGITSGTSMLMSSMGQGGGGAAEGPSATQQARIENRNQRRWARRNA